MYDLDAMSSEQLVTATDRLLFGGPRRRPSAARFEYVVEDPAEVPIEEATVYVRDTPPSVGSATRITVLSAVFGAAIGTLIVAASTLLGSR